MGSSIAHLEPEFFIDHHDEEENDDFDDDDYDDKYDNITMMITMHKECLCEGRHLAVFGRAKEVDHLGLASHITKLITLTWPREGATCKTTKPLLSNFIEISMVDSP